MIPMNIRVAPESPNASNKRGSRRGSRALVHLGIPGAAVLAAGIFWALLNPSPAATKTQNTAPTGVMQNASARAELAAPEAIGRLSGDDVAVSGAATFNVESGRSSAMLASGSEVTVRSGQAKVSLVEGGEIAICGPAHLSLLKSGNAITLALDYGRVHPQLNSDVSLMIYTPLIVATGVPVARDPSDITVGLDVQGEMCALADRGAVRLAQQLSGQSLLVPEGGQANLNGGELKPLSVSRTCTCELPVARNAGSKQLEIGVPGHSPIASAPPPVQTPPPDNSAIYRVDMPPLTFGSDSPTPPPDPDPQTIVLVRESRVQPDAVFQGHVVAAPPAAASDPAKGASPADPESPPKKRNIVIRFLRHFRP
jgi:hypothetical protein